MFRQSKEPVKCPVGREILGYRWIEEAYSAYCKDCRFTYYFKSGENFPHRNGKGTIDDHTCGCGRCGD